MGVGDENWTLDGVATDARQRYSDNKCVRDGSTLALVADLAMEHLQERLVSTTGYPRLQFHADTSRGGVQFPRLLQ